jgi:hypothetical protein
LVYAGLQPRGGSDAGADFAEQVAVWILDCPGSGGDSGPEALREAQGRVRYRAPKRRFRREGRVKFCGYCTLGHKQFMCFYRLKYVGKGMSVQRDFVYKHGATHAARLAAPYVAQIENVDISAHMKIKLELEERKYGRTRVHKRNTAEPLGLL